MNTLRDTDEGKPRPSVWPVYVMSGIIGLLSLSFLVFIGLVPWWEHVYAEYPERFQHLPPSPQQFADMLQRLVPYAPLFALYGLFGIVTAVATAELRSWGWWCAVIWLAAYFVYQIFMTVSLGMSKGSLAGIPMTTACFCLIIWALVTRRQLFFPPKPEGEE